MEDIDDKDKDVMKELKKENKALNIICLSDTHGKHGELNIEGDYDISIFSGDAGTYRDPYQNESSILDFIEWYASLCNIKHKIWIAGNHCTSIERGLVDAKKLSEEKGLIYLQHESIEIEGFKFFGSPYTPKFGYGWAFNIDRGESMRKLWGQVPDNTEILITHGPPKGILDMTKSGEQVGCEDLSNRIKELKNIKLVQYGHIHEDYGCRLVDDIYFVNASVLNLMYELKNKPYEFEVIDNKKIVKI